MGCWGRLRIRRAILYQFALARARQLSLYFPGVILNPVRDDLRMMAPKPVAARDGAMKENQDNKRVMFITASNSSCQDSLLSSCPIDRQLNAK